MGSLYAGIILKGFTCSSADFQPTSIAVRIYLDDQPVEIIIPLPIPASFDIRVPGVSINNVIELKVDEEPIGVQSLETKDGTLAYPIGELTYSLSYTCYP